MTFASVDWIMSLDPHWYSTIFGLLTVAGQGLVSLAFTIAVLAMIVLSANDVATAVGEKLGGSEEGFAALMTRKARSLGMMNTTFFNASGLPHAQQFTTARDMSTLGVALMRDFPKEYELFATKSFKFRGKTITGRLPAKTPVRAGEKIDLAVAPADICYFDPETTLRLD